MGNTIKDILQRYTNRLQTELNLFNNQINNINSTIEPMVFAKASAAYHNSIYRGKDITSYYTDGTLYKRINGTNGFTAFEDLYIGDYFTVSMPAMGSLRSAGNVTFVITAFNYFYNCGDTALTKNHITVKVYTYLFTHAWNSNGSTAGGYFNSEIHTLLNSDTDGVKSAYQSVFGEHLITYRDLLSTSVDANASSPRFPGQSGASNSWAWKDTTIRLPSEIMIYGSITWSSSGYDTGCACIQLPYYRFNIQERNSHRVAWIWLSDVVTNATVAFAYRNGSATCSTVATAGSVAPLVNLS